jgi:hypothetical protein
MTATQGDVAWAAREQLFEIGTSLTSWALEFHYGTNDSQFGLPHSYYSHLVQI